MKKLLSLLAAVGLTATAATSVVACGSSQSDEDKNLTKNILSGNLGINSTDIMKDLQDRDQWGLIFGDEGSALNTFTNYAAEAFMKYSDKLKTRVDEYTKTNPDAASYIDDGMWDAISNDWKTRQSNANDAWDKQISDAKDNDGKQWEDKLFDSMKSQFGEYIYDGNGSKKKASSYSDYKNLYISYQILNGQSSSGSLSDSLKNDIYLWGTAPNGDPISSIKSTILTQVFKNDKGISFGGQKDINFVKNNAKNQGVPASDRDKTWFGQMDNYIKAVQQVLSKVTDKNPLSGDDKTYTDYLVNMINITGGYNIEEQIGEKEDRSNFQMGAIKWASEDNLKDNLKDIPTLSNNLIKRFDDKYDQDFGDKVNTKETADVANLVINRNYDFTKEIGTIYSDKTSTNQINGLYSNSQRFVANNYYQVEKPVAISEIVVKPLYSNGKALDQFVTNTGYVGTDTTQMDNFYRFLGNFIDNNLTGYDFTTANTGSVADGTSDYSWDKLMKQGVGKVADVNGISWDSTFNGNVSFTTHSNLLTRDSSSSDYSDILKYSVYDYLQNGGTPISLKDTKAPEAGKVPFNISEATIAAQNQGPAGKNLQTEYDVISGLLQSLSRTADAGSMYKVVNPNQGIIAFTDASGIHFVRIEGYNVLEKAAGDKQTPLSLKGDSFNDDTLNQYHTAQLLTNELNGNETVKAAAMNITSDYTEHTDLTGDQNTAHFKYNDLNKGFGNKYLQFLANTSIPKSNGASDTKYSYDLSALLSSYTSGDISSSNLQTSSNMLWMVWSYIKEITGWTDEQLFEFVANNGDVKASSNSKPVQSLIYDPLRVMNLSDEDEITFAKAYENYILGAVGIIRDGSRDQTSKNNFIAKYAEADKTFAKGNNWKDDKDLITYRPSLTFKDAAKGASDNWYAEQAEALEGNDKWMPFKANDKSAKQAGFYVTSNDELLTYKVDMSKFAINNHALKVGEE